MCNVISHFTCKPALPKLLLGVIHLLKESFVIVAFGYTKFYDNPVYDVFQVLLWDEAGKELNRLKTRLTQLYYDNLLKVRPYFPDPNFYFSPSQSYRDHNISYSADKARGGTGRMARCSSYSSNTLCCCVWS